MGAIKNWVIWSPVLSHFGIGIQFLYLPKTCRRVSRSVSKGVPLKSWENRSCFWPMDRLEAASGRAWGCGCLPRGKGVPYSIVFMVGDSHSLVYLYLVNAILSSNSFSTTCFSHSSPPCSRWFLLSLIILLVELVLSFPWGPLPSFKQAILPYFLPSSPPPESCFPYCESLLAVSTLLSATPFLSVCHYPR